MTPNNGYFWCWIAILTLIGESNTTEIEKDGRIKRNNFHLHAQQIQNRRIQDSRIHNSLTQLQPPAPVPVPVNVINSGKNRKLSPHFPQKSAYVPPYAVKMEPLVHYSQRDPLYNDREIAYNVTSVSSIGRTSKDDVLAESTNNIEYSSNFISGHNFGPQHSNFHSQPFHHYYKVPEPIIEIIIKESNETLPPPPALPPPPPPTKEPIQVFYVKYKKNQTPYGKEEVVYEEPIPALTPISTDVVEHTTKNHYPSTTYPNPPPPSTTLRTIIHPDSEIFHGTGLKVTFGNSEESQSPDPNLPYEKRSATVDEAEKRESSVIEHTKHGTRGTPILNNKQDDSVSGKHFINERQSPFNLNLQHPGGQRIRDSSFEDFVSRESSNSPQRVVFPGNQEIPFRPQHLTNFNIRPQHSQIRHQPSQEFQQPDLASIHQRNLQQQQFQSQVNLQEHERLQRQRQQDHLESISAQYPGLYQNIQLQKTLSTIAKPNSNIKSGSQISQPAIISNYPSQSQSLPYLQPILTPIVPSHEQQQTYQSQLNGNQKSPGVIPLDRTRTQKEPSNFRTVSSLSQNLRVLTNEPSRPQIAVNPNVQDGRTDSISSQYSQQPELDSEKQFQRNKPQRRPPLLEENKDNRQPHKQQEEQQRHEQSKESLSLQQHYRQQQQQLQQQIQPQIDSQQELYRQYQLQLLQQQQTQQRQPQQTEAYQALYRPQETEERKRQDELYKNYLQQNSNKQSNPNVRYNINQSPTSTTKSPKQPSKSTTSRPAVQDGQIFQSISQSEEHQILRDFERLRQPDIYSKQRLNNKDESINSDVSTNIYNNVSPTEQTYYSPIPNSIYQLTNSETNTKQESRYKNKNNNQFALSSSARPPNVLRNNYAERQREPTTERNLNKESNAVSKLPDEVPDELRQQLLSSGILSNADIQVLDYDKVGDIPIENLPPEALESLYGAGSAPVASVMLPNGTKPVEMKVVRYDPSTSEGREIERSYLRDDSTKVDPVVLNDSSYNRYLPLKVSGSQFPVPDNSLLKGKKVASVVILAPIDYDFAQHKENSDTVRTGKSAPQLHGVHFVSGDAIKSLVKDPTEDNFQNWLAKEKSTSQSKQSVVLLVANSVAEDSNGKEIFMYDVQNGEVSKLEGQLSSAFVDVAESNAESEDLENLSDSEEHTSVSELSSEPVNEIMSEHFKNKSRRNVKQNINNKINGKYITR